MLTPARAAAAGALALWCGASVALTVADRNVWPLSAYNVFNFVPTPMTQEVEVTLTRSDGKVVSVLPGQTLPIEFFNARSTLIEVFVRGDDPVQQIELARTMLERLNAHPWAGFDETWPAARSAQDPKFVALSIDLVLRDYRRVGPGFGRAIERNSVFEYQAR